MGHLHLEKETFNQLRKQTTGCDFLCCKYYFKLICSELPEAYSVLWLHVFRWYTFSQNFPRSFLKERAVLNKITDGRRYGGSVPMQWIWVKWEVINLSILQDGFAVIQLASRGANSETLTVTPYLFLLAQPQQPLPFLQGVWGLSKWCLHMAQKVFWYPAVSSSRKFFSV